MKSWTLLNISRLPNICYPSGLSTALTCGSPGTWKVLVVDENSKALLESVYQLFDILHMNITGKF
jgi:hypothetical protein